MQSLGEEERAGCGRPGHPGVAAALAEAAVAAEGSLSGAGLNNFGSVRRCHVLNMSLLLSFHLLGLLVSSGQGRSAVLYGFYFPSPLPTPPGEAREDGNERTKVIVFFFFFWVAVAVIFSRLLTVASVS